MTTTTAPSPSPLRLPRVAGERWRLVGKEPGVRQIVTDPVGEIYEVYLAADRQAAEWAGVGDIEKRLDERAQLIESAPRLLEAAWTVCKMLSGEIPCASGEPLAVMETAVRKATERSR